MDDMDLEKRMQIVQDNGTTFHYNEETGEWTYSLLGDSPSPDTQYTSKCFPSFVQALNDATEDYLGKAKAFINGRWVDV